MDGTAQLVLFLFKVEAPDVNNIWIELVNKQGIENTILIENERQFTKRKVHRLLSQLYWMN